MCEGLLDMIVISDFTKLIIGFLLISISCLFSCVSKATIYFSYYKFFLEVQKGVLSKVESFFRSVLSFSIRSNLILSILSLVFFILGRVFNHFAIGLVLVDFRRVEGAFVHLGNLFG